VQKPEFPYFCPLNLGTHLIFFRVRKDLVLRKFTVKGDKIWSHVKKNGYGYAIFDLRKHRIGRIAGFAAIAMVAGHHA
jgi:hypothetical protein